MKEERIGAVEYGVSGCSQYAEALGFVLTHELAQLNAGASQDPVAAGGGLSVWQCRLLARHVKDHLAGQIPVARLAELARLSLYHFCCSFTRSFGMSPHRYHSNRRVERAKTLLANCTLSVAEVALEVGFCETSSFSTMFRKLIERTPTDYRCTLVPNAA